MLTQAQLEERIKTDFGIDVKAADSATLSAPVIPVIPQRAYELLRNNASNPGFLVLDVRTPAEFGGGHVPEATNVDFEASDFAAQLSKLNNDKTSLVYCHTGSRSGQATALMNSMGFKHVYDVQGGMSAWEAAVLRTPSSRGPVPLPCRPSPAGGGGHSLPVRVPTKASRSGSALTSRPTSSPALQVSSAISTRSPRRDSSRHTAPVSSHRRSTSTGAFGFEPGGGVTGTAPGRSCRSG